MLWSLNNINNNNLSQKVSKLAEIARGKSTIH